MNRVNILINLGEIDFFLMTVINRIDIISNYIIKKQKHIKKPKKKKKKKLQI